MSNIKQRTTLKKSVLATAIVASIALVLFFILNKSPSNSVVLEKGSVAETSQSTPEEKKTADNQKQANIERDRIDNSAKTGTIKEVTPIIVFLDQSGDVIESGALINGVYEDGGTCIFTAKQAAQTVTKTSSAVKNPTTTDCIPFSIPTSDFPSKGSWVVTISYKSLRGQGTSAPQTVQVK